MSAPHPSSATGPRGATGPSRSAGRSASRTGPLLIGLGPRGAGRLPAPWVVLLDAVLLVVLGVAALWPLGAAYSGRQWLVASLIGLVLGAALAWVGARWRWGVWVSVLALLAAYLVLGSAAALPDDARRRLLPTPETLHDLVIGAVQTWRQALTLPTPLGESGVVLLVPFISALVGAFVAALWLWRSRLPGLAGLVLGLLLVVGCAFGDIEAGAAVLRGLALAVIGAVWLRWRSAAPAGGRRTRRAVATVLVVGAAAAPAAGLALVGGDQPRVVLRDHVATPFDPRDYPSPLAKFRAYRKEPVRTGSTLFTVDGLESGTLVRLAVMDTYDGVVWNVSGGPGSVHDSGTFRRLRNDPEAEAREAVRGRITIGDYTGVWVPSVGETLSMTPERDGRLDSAAAAELVINRQTGTVAEIGGVRQGTTFDVVAGLPPTPPEEEISQLEADTSVVLPAPAIVPEELTDRIQRWQTEAGFSGGTDGELAQFLRDSFRERGYYSDGVDDFTPAGHGASRLAVLTKTPTPVGNAEQYAAAMALAGQRLGLPSRVVLGFKVPPGGGAVRGENVTAWTEVRFKGAGWVAFDPTPPEDQKLRQPNDEPNEEPQPQVLQPPRVPGEPQEATDNLQQGQGRKQRIDVLGVIGAVLGVVWDVAQVLVLTSPLWGVLLYKGLRRRRRRRASDPTLRLTGAWQELADRTRDLGVRPGPGTTRREGAYAVAERYADTDVGVVALAHTADRHVYGPDRPSEEEARAYWSDVDSALRRIRRASPWWRRLIARFSLASVPWRALLRRRRAALGRRLRRAGARLAQVPPLPRLRALAARRPRADDARANRRSRD